MKGRIEMFEETTLTSYAPALRYTNGQLALQHNLIAQNELIVKLINSISQMVLVLNKHRQIVYSNSSFSQFFKIKDIEKILGKRTCEIMSCTNAFRTKAGCGTSEFCKSCGAVNAILESQKGVKSTKECKILTSNNDAYDLRVTATPFPLNGENLTIFSITDISAEKRKESLERVFLHDILNSAGGISGLSTIMKELDDPAEINDIAETIANAADNLVDEIKIQRELNAAESGDLKPEFNPIETHSIIHGLKQVYSKHELNPSKKIYIHPEAKNTLLNTDRILLQRVLANMIKNGIDALVPNDEITLNCLDFENHVRFSVHNKSFIPNHVQLQLFRRTFSTKGVGRGIGTYCMKLLGEKYLNGNVWFESSEATGTTFFIELQKDI